MSPTDNSRITDNFVKNALSELLRDHIPLLPADYPKQLEQMGISCVKFHPFRPFLSAIQNNRDHCKIISIDGTVVFTGGISLADEYSNAIERFGHRKDAAIKVEGEVAWSFTLMFLQMWEACRREDRDYSRYYPWQSEPCQVTGEGFAQPYSDSPDPILRFAEFASGNNILDKKGVEIFRQLCYNNPHKHEVAMQG